MREVLKSLLVVFSLLMFALILPPQSMVEAKVLFEDNFDGDSLDATIWNTDHAVSGKRWCLDDRVIGTTGTWLEVASEPCHSLTQQPPYGTITVGGGQASLSAGAGFARTFPYFWVGQPSRQSPFPATGDFIYEVRMRYYQLPQTDLRIGTGIVAYAWVNSDPVGNNSPEILDQVVFGIWPGTTTLRHNFLNQPRLDMPDPLAFHTYSLEYIDGVYTLYIDDMREAGPTPHSLRPSAIWIGSSNLTHWFIPQWPSFTIDYIRVTVPDADDEDAMDVPHFLQTDPLWNNVGEIYDSADAWNIYGVPNNISTWGCALTSAAMVLNHYGVNEFYGVNDVDNNFPDGTEINPGTLNKWLSSNAGMYWRDGQTDWVSIAGLTHKINEATGATQKLEWSRIETDDFTVIDSWAGQGRPDILDLHEPLSPSGTHFAVVNGVVESGVEYLIRDPFFDRESLFSSEVGLRKIERYVPTNSNFSYLVVHSDGNLDLLLEHSSGLKTGSNGTTEYEQLDSSWYMFVNPLNGYTDSEVVTAGEGFNEIGASKPLEGEYNLSLYASESGWYEFEVYGYGDEAEPDIRKERVYLGAEEPAIYEFGYEQNDGGLTEFHRQVDFEQLIRDIELGVDEGWFKNKGVATSLTKIIRNAGRMYEKNPRVGRVMISSWEKLIRIYERTGLISSEAAGFLLQELVYLRASI